MYTELLRSATKYKTLNYDMTMQKYTVKSNAKLLISYCCMAPHPHTINTYLDLNKSASLRLF